VNGLYLLNVLTVQAGHFYYVLSLNGEMDNTVLLYESLIIYMANRKLMKV
jgi:hypothetical protein